MKNQAFIIKLSGTDKKLIAARPELRNLCFDLLVEGKKLRISKVK